MAVLGRAVDRKSFAARLYQLQIESELTQADIVRRAGDTFGQGHYTNWIRAVNAPSILYIDAIAAAIGCEPWELLEDPSPDYIRKWEAKYDQRDPAKKGRRK